MTTTLEVTPLNHTALHAQHVVLGAKMTPFAGWDMPLQYSRVNEEHMAVREAAGLFDVSHMGIIPFQADSVETILGFLDRLVPRDLSRRLPAGKAVYTQLLNESGGILDDIILYRLPEGETHPAFENFAQVFMVANASNTPAVLEWLTSHLNQWKTETPSLETLGFECVSTQYALLALQGPKFQAVLQALGGDVSGLIPEKRFQTALGTVTVAGQTIPLIAARTGYTGEDGVELFVPQVNAKTLWNALLAAGKPLGLLPTGLACRDTLRIEAGLPLHGQDITPNTTPIEAGLGWSADVEKATPFIGQPVLQQQKKQQQAGTLAKQFICFTLAQNTIPRTHDVLKLNGQPVGEVTSGTASPCLKQAIGMGYAQLPAGTPALTVGDTLTYTGRRGEMEAIIVPRPFYKPA